MKGKFYFVWIDLIFFLLVVVGGGGGGGVEGIQYKL